MGERHILRRVQCVYVCMCEGGVGEVGGDYKDRLATALVTFVGSSATLARAR